MDFNLFFDSTFYLLASLHCVIGTTAAIIAVNKGYSLWRWLLIGLVGGTFALVWSIFLEKNDSI
jgi:uncharacterized membrane-anchored protein